MNKRRKRRRSVVRVEGVNLANHILGSARHDCLPWGAERVLMLWRRRLRRRAPQKPGEP
jgi:hypothetical protein